MQTWSMGSISSLNSCKVIFAKDLWHHPWSMLHDPTCDVSCISVIIQDGGPLATFSQNIP